MTNTTAEKPAARTVAPDQTAWHTKTSPKGELCDVCGCASPRKGVTHRALAGDEVHQGHRDESGRPAFYAVRKTVCFGTDYHVTYVWG